MFSWCLGKDETRAKVWKHSVHDRKSPQFDKSLPARAHHRHVHQMKTTVTCHTCLSSCFSLQDSSFGIFVWESHCKVVGFKTVGKCAKLIFSVTVAQGKNNHFHLWTWCKKLKLYLNCVYIATVENSTLFRTIAKKLHPHKKTPSVLWQMLPNG